MMRKLSTWLVVFVLFHWTSIKYLPQCYSLTFDHVIGPWLGCQHHSLGRCTVVWSHKPATPPPRHCPHLSPGYGHHCSGELPRGQIGVKHITSLVYYREAFRFCRMGLLIILVYILHPPLDIQCSKPNHIVCGSIFHGPYGCQKVNLP